MCQEAILLWFEYILQIKCGTIFLDLFDGVILELLLNKFNSIQFPLNDVNQDEPNFILNFSRIQKLVNLINQYQQFNSQIDVMLIAKEKNESELSKLIFNIINIIFDWNLAKEQLQKLRVDQIQYIYSFLQTEDQKQEQNILLKKLIEQENQNNTLDSQNIQLNQQIEQQKQQNLELQNLLIQKDNKLKEQQEEIEINKLSQQGQTFDTTIESLKQELVISKITISNYEKRIQLYEDDIQDKINAEKKCIDLEKEIQQLKANYNQEILDDLHQKNQILKEQVKNLDDCSRAQKENSFFTQSFFSQSKQKQQKINILDDTQIQEQEIIIDQLKQKIRNLEEELLDFKKPKMINEKLLTTPRLPKSKTNYMSDQKPPRNSGLIDNKLEKQNTILRKIIDQLTQQQELDQSNCQKQHGRMRSLNF